MAVFMEIPERISTHWRIPIGIYEFIIDYRWISSEISGIIPDRNFKTTTWGISGESLEKYLKHSLKKLSQCVTWRKPWRHLCKNLCRYFTTNLWRNHWTHSGRNSWRTPYRNISGKIPGRTPNKIPEGIPEGISGALLEPILKIWKRTQVLPLGISGKTASGTSGEIAVGITLKLILKEFLVKSLKGKNSWGNLRKCLLKGFLKVIVENLLEPDLNWSQNVDF